MLSVRNCRSSVLCSTPSHFSSLPLDKRCFLGLSLYADTSLLVITVHQFLFTSFFLLSAVFFVLSLVSWIWFFLFTNAPYTGVAFFAWLFIGMFPVPSSFLVTLNVCDRDLPLSSSASSASSDNAIFARTGSGLKQLVRFLRIDSLLSRKRMEPILPLAAESTSSAPPPNPTPIAEATEGGRISSRLAPPSPGSIFRGASPQRANRS